MKSCRRTRQRLRAGAVLVAVWGLLQPFAVAESAAVNGAVWLGRGRVDAVDPSRGPVRLRTVLVGVSLGARFEHLLLGGSAEVGGEFLGHDELFLSLHGGLTTALDRSRVSVLGEVGGHSYDQMGDGILSGDFATKATLPFVGVRVVADRSWREHGQGALLGLWFGVRQDVGTAMVRDADGDKDWRVGGTSLMGGVRLGFDAAVNGG